MSDITSSLNRKRLMREIIEEASDRETAAADDRKLLVAYLKYAVADVAQINETSALLLQMAIADLESQQPGGEGPPPQ
jgi:hypothetical protein